jgi:hypothetical protein
MVVSERFVGIFGGLNERGASSELDTTPPEVSASRTRGDTTGIGIDHAA